MKKVIKSVVIAVLAAMLVFAFVGCEELEEPPPPPLPPPPPTVINIAAIQGVTVPAKDGIPVTAIIENTQYSGTVEWSPYVNYVFANSTVYTATITLTAKSGYTLSGVAADFFTVAGAKSVSNDANSGVITALFSATAPTSTSSVSISIAAPVKGATPRSTASGVGNFSIGLVSWSPNNNPFLGNMEYTASVTLTAHSGYTFAGLSSATINGQNATISINTSSIVTLSYKFPKTDEKAVSSIAIKTQPTKLTYTHGDTLDLTGLVIALTHDDKTTEDVLAANFTAKNITANPAHGNNLIYSTHNGKPVNITYGSLTCNTSNLIVNRVIPTVADFNISGTGTFIYDGNTKVVTIAPKEGKSTGARTIKYNGNTTAPSAADTYTVTFDVAATEIFDTVSGLYAGTLTIGKATPTADDFNISGIGTFTYGNTRYVTITPKVGKSTGTITKRYNGSTTEPSKVGSYTVTFDVAATTNYNAVNGLFAGIMEIIPQPITSLNDLKNYSQRSSPIGTILAEEKFPWKAGVTSDGHFFYVYTIALNVNDITGIGDMLKNYECFFILDISGSTITTIPDSAFYSCGQLLGIIIPDSVISIGERAFYDCWNLTNITIPNSVTYIGNYALSACTSLSAINVAVDNSAYIEQDGILYNKNKTKLISYPAGKTTSSFSIPNSVTAIGERAFASCVKLTSITIPNSVTSIGNAPFSNCTSLTVINVDSGSINYSSDQGVLYNKNKTMLIAYPAGKSASSFNIPNGVTAIGERAFASCVKLTSITIPNSVTSIGIGAFSGCVNLTSIIIPNSVTSIENGAFSLCNGLISVTFQGVITSSNLGSNAFDSVVNDLREKYLAGGVGTYKRRGDGTLSSPYIWTKQ
jgi:hypothetical protein